MMYPAILRAAVHCFIVLIRAYFGINYVVP